MGTAPQSTEAPDMPDPRRTVIRSRGMLRQRGYSDHDAYLLIIHVVKRARRDLQAMGIHDHGWLAKVAAVAREMGSVPESPDTEYAGDDYGDGNSGQPGRTDRGTQAAAGQRGQGTGQRGREPDPRS